MNVPEVAEKLRAYYASNDERSQGGFVHIVLEDSNTEQKHADWCLQEAEQHGDAFDVEIAQLLAGMSRTQRKKLSAMSHYWPRSWTA